MAEQTADGGGLLDSLSNINLPIFDGVPEQDKQRALLTTALELMRPQDPLKGGGDGQIVEALSRSVGAGLGELDVREDRRDTLSNTQVQRSTALRGARSDERRADSREITADAIRQNSETALKTEEREGFEFGEEKALREATADMRVAEAEWLRRRYPGGPAGSGASALKLEEINTTTQALLDDPKNEVRYRKPDGTQNKVLARVDAYQALNMEELLGNPALAVIVGSEEEAATIRDRVNSLQPSFTGEGEKAALAAGAPIVITSQEQFDAGIADQSIKPGDTVIINGVEKEVE